MKARMVALGAVVMFGAVLCAEETSKDMPEMPRPTPQHEWLKKFVGEWETSTKVYMEPGADPVEGTGSESARMLGGFWVVGEGEGAMMGTTMNWLLTFGYDAEKKTYVGRWIDSMTGQAWDYTGSVDDAGKVLTLNTSGFCPMEGKVCNFRSTVEFRSDDERVFTERKQNEDGSWVTAVVSTYIRKKP